MKIEYNASSPDNNKGLNSVGCTCSIELLQVLKNAIRDLINVKIKIMDGKSIYIDMYDKAAFIQPYIYYYLTFNAIPSRMGIKNVDKNKLYNCLIEKYALSEDRIIKSQSFDQEKNKVWHSYVLFDIGNHCMIFFNSNWGCYPGAKLVEVLYSYKTDSGFRREVEELVKSYIIKEEIKSEINLICKDDTLSLSSFEIPNTNLDLGLNYNDDFIEIDKIIKERLNKPKDKGIVLLHGLPGTGKTNYIRHLISSINKRMIYLPPDLVYEIGSPGFLSFLSYYSESVLVIEDAENVIMERSGGSNGAISNLLNLCDGLLSDCLNIQVVCSFNTDISKIDKALMRKGRLIAKYEFQKLTVDKAQQLSDSLGFSKIVTQSMTVSEIYNQDQKEFACTTQASIGFGRNKIVA
ncbi:AAA family ATPase [Sporocytophaga myxococcoides]|uniref:AAA family ATPase n=1 Tax=Sporocytophaga myxococcoides TaxID=153721 RepID=UPI00068573EF|nr:AAA family ATPase [Sporocytophaga myxococcoides]